MSSEAESTAVSKASLCVVVSLGVVVGGTAASALAFLLYTGEQVGTVLVTRAAPILFKPVWRTTQWLAGQLLLTLQLVAQPCRHDSEEEHKLATGTGTVRRRPGCSARRRGRGCCRCPRRHRRRSCGARRRGEYRALDEYSFPPECEPDGAPALAPTGICGAPDRGLHNRSAAEPWH